MRLRSLDPRIWLGVLLVVTLASLLLGSIWVKGPCLDATWDGFQYERRCYTDLVPLYGGRDLDERQMPYVESFNEYPVLTGMWMYLASLVATDAKSFFIWNAVGLSVAGLVVTWTLWRIGERSVHVFWWAAAPALALYAFHNWDLLAVLFVVLGLHAYLRGRPLASGIWMGLGVAAKLFPLFLLPILAADLVRRSSRDAGAPLWRGLKARGPWRFALGTAGAWLAVNLPFIVVNRTLWWATYSFHAGRGPTTGSHWRMIRFYADRWEWEWLTDLVDPGTLGILSPLLLAGGVLALALGVLLGRLDVVPAGTATLCVVLLANQVFSPQYILWLVPWLALVPGLSWQRKGFLLAMDVLVYLSSFDYFHTTSLVDMEKLALASMLRALGLALVLVHFLTGPGGLRLGPSRRPAGPASR